MTDTPLGERELDVMAALWELRSGTVSEVLAHLGEPLAYTTILTILRNLEAKQCVRREEEGRGHRYFPLVERQAAQRSALARLMDGFFQGSPQALLAQLVNDHAVTDVELQALAKQLRQTRRMKRGDA
jgi:BlaI family transcriptional regulator, penicillinase repressor